MSKIPITKEAINMIIPTNAKKLNSIEGITNRITTGIIINIDPNKILHNFLSCE